MTGSAQFMPAIDRDDILRSSELLARDGFVRIPSFLAAADAEVLAALLQGELKWNLATRLRSKDWDATPEEQEAIGLARMEAMASSGIADDFRYLYDVVRVDSKPSKRSPRTLALDRLADCWSTPAAFAIWSKLTGRNGVNGLVMAATRFRPGHFLTRHDDDNEGKRVAAFALSLSRNWRAEWGGLLEFVDAEGDIERGFVPAFNSLMLFAVPREHIVSVVAPFAPAARLTISGWLTVELD